MKKEKINEDLLKKVVEYKSTLVDRYYQTIWLTIGLKNYCEANPQLGVNFIGAETILKRGENKLNPDILLQGSIQNTNLGLPVEIKTSMSIDSDIFSTLKKMERYNDDLTGWKTENGQVDNHAIILSPNNEDSGRVKRILTKGIEENGVRKNVEYKKEFIIWEWGMMVSNKFSQSEIILLKQSYGDLSNLGLNEFNEVITDGIKININDEGFNREKEKNIFTRQRPPTEHIMNELWYKMFPSLCINGRLTNIKEILVGIREFYTSSIMQDINGNKYKIRKEWIKEAMDNFVDIGLAKTHSDDNYEFFIEKKTKKDILTYICEKLAKKQIIDGSDSDVNRIVKEYKGLTELKDFTEETEELK